MKHLFMSVLFMLAIGHANSQINVECHELNYSPQYLNPVVVDGDTLLPAPPLGDPPNPPTIGETRGIFWVHGLGGNAYSWDRANEATVLGANGFPARDVITAQLTYGVSALSTAGLNLESVIWDKKTPFQTAGVTDHTQNFVIAHSQGGLVARMTDQHYEVIDRRMFGGVVTFGTPHGGAYILNSRNNRQIEYLAQEGCVSIGGAKLLEDLGRSTSPLLFAIISGGLLDILNGACNAGASVLPELLFSELNTPISNEYHVGAPELGDLNAFNHPNIEKVAMYGVEYADGESEINPKQLMWRTFSSRNATSAPVFSADDDDELVNFANAETALYLERYLTNQALGTNRARKAGGWASFGVLGTLVSLFHSTRASEYFKKAEAYRKAHHFMQRADDRWKYIIGAKAEVPISEESCMCEWINNIDGWSHFGMAFATTLEECEAVANNPAPGEYIFCDWTPVYETQSKRSDGVVLAESQVAFPGAQPYYMDKTNHFQMRNSTKTKEALRDLYNGEIDPFFETQIK